MTSCNCKSNPCCDWAAHYRPPEDFISKGDNDGRTRKTTAKLSRRDPAQRTRNQRLQQPETKPVVDLLTSILNEVQKQVRVDNTDQPLEGEAAGAVEQFREIVAALALHRTDNHADADPTKFRIMEERRN